MVNRDTSSFREGSEATAGSPAPSASPGGVAPTSPSLIHRADGLTDAEGLVMDSLVAASEAFAHIERQHPQELAEFVGGIHICQDLLAVRIARRHYPLGWPVKV